MDTLGGLDETARMGDLEVRRERADEAIHQFAGAAVVYLLDGAPGEASRFAANGSGTLLKTPGGAIVLLTAKHVLTDERPDQFSIGGRCYQKGALTDALGEEWHHPEVDVALARLTPAAASAVGSAAPATSVVATTSDGAHDEPATFILCGFPGEYRRETVDHSRKVIEHGFIPISYFSVIEGLDRGRYRFRWDEGVVESTAFQDLGIRPGLQALKHPRGISGGPLWRFRVAKKGELWASERIGALIGVASAFRDPHELIEPITAWGDWFRETVASIDSAT